MHQFLASWAEPRFVKHAFYASVTCQVDKETTKLTKQRGCLFCMCMIWQLPAWTLSQALNSQRLFLLLGYKNNARQKFCWGPKLCPQDTKVLVTWCHDGAQMLWTWCCLQETVRMKHNPRWSFGEKSLWRCRNHMQSGHIRRYCDVKGAGRNRDWEGRKMFNLLKWCNPEVVPGLYNEVLNLLNCLVKCAICSEVCSRSGCRGRAHVIDRRPLPTVSVEQVIVHFRLCSLLILKLLFAVNQFPKNHDSIHWDSMKKSKGGDYQ